MLENTEKCRILNSKVMSSDDLFCLLNNPKSKVIQFAIT